MVTQPQSDQSQDWISAALSTYRNSLSSLSGPSPFGSLPVPDVSALLCLGLAGLGVLGAQLAGISGAAFDWNFQFLRLCVYFAGLQFLLSLSLSLQSKRTSSERDGFRFLCMLGNFVVVPALFITAAIVESWPWWRAGLALLALVISSAVVLVLSPLWAYYLLGIELIVSSVVSILLSPLLLLVFLAGLVRARLSPPRGRTSGVSRPTPLFEVWRKTLRYRMLLAALGTTTLSALLSPTLWRLFATRPQFTVLALGLLLLLTAVVTSQIIRHESSTIWSSAIVKVRAEIVSGTIQLPSGPFIVDLCAVSLFTIGIINLIGVPKHSPVLP